VSIGGSSGRALVLSPESCPTLGNCTEAGVGDSLVMLRLRRRKSIISILSVFLVVGQLVTLSLFAIPARPVCHLSDG
jgi:hypothetical protein